MAEQASGLLVFLALIVALVIVIAGMVADRRAWDEKETGYLTRIVQLESELDWRRKRVTVERRLEDLDERGWRVVLKSHEYAGRDDEGRKVRGMLGWCVTAIPKDRQRYVRWETLTGAVMPTLEEALGDTEQRVARIEDVERSEAAAAR